jgi:hypothetical protein
VLDELPWFDAGQPLHNWMLHETDFYDEVEQIWGRRWGAEGIGALRAVHHYLTGGWGIEDTQRPELLLGELS